MEIVVTQEQGRVPVNVYRVSGEINVNSYEALVQRAREDHDAGANDVVIDLTGVTYVSSAGIRAITSIFRMLRGSSAEESAEAMQKGLADGTFKSPHLKLAGAGKNVAEVLKLSGVDMFLEIHATAKQAVASF
jgi:anti-anti-sigma factor